MDAIPMILIGPLTYACQHGQAASESPHIGQLTVEKILWEHGPEESYNIESRHQ